MLRQGIGGHRFDLEIAALARFGGCRELPARHPADEGKDQLVLVGLAINACQAFNGCLQAGFLPDFTDNGFGGQLAAFNPAAGQIPGIDIAPVAQQDPALFIEDNRKCAD